MAERSQFWSVTGVGDGVSLGDEELAEWVAGMVSSSRGTDGVYGGVGGQCKVTAGSGQVSVADGIGFVNGWYYQNSASVNLSIPTPGAGVTGHRIVLRRDQSTQTVRAALKSSADGVSSAPAVTQSTDIWEITLATVQVATDGTITVTDMRDYCRPTPAFIYRRRGGSASDWSKAGTTTYNPGGMFFQCGVQNLPFTDDERADRPTITFPQAFSDVPLVLVGILQNGAVQGARIAPSIYSKSKSSVTLDGYHTDDDDHYTGTPAIQWLAFGPM